MCVCVLFACHRIVADTSVSLYWMQGKFEQAIYQFQLGSTDPLRVIALFPELVPADQCANVNYPLKVTKVLGAKATAQVQDSVVSAIPPCQVSFPLMLPSSFIKTGRPLPAALSADIEGPSAALRLL